MASAEELEVRKCLSYGADFERAEHWSAAENFYRRALKLDAGDPFVRYFANNNLAYVLIQMQKFDAASEYCKVAIGIHPNQYNAHKNLGLACMGQGLAVDAAWSFITATRLCPKNPRAWQYLEQLLRDRPGLLGQNAELAEIVAVMRRALEEQGCLQEPLEASPMFQPVNLPLTQ